MGAVITRPSPRARFPQLLGAARVYAVTDDTVDPDLLVDVVEMAVHAGIRLIQYRDKQHSDADQVRIASTLVGAVHQHGGLLIVNDRADIAIAAGADGAHVGQDDLPLEAARAILGPDLVLGASASHLEEIEPACAAGIDYLGFGAVYPTDTKLDAEYAGLDLLEQACRLSRVPVVAIGGISVDRVPAVLARGAAGVAVVSALFRTHHPGDAAGALIRASSNAP